MVSKASHIDVFIGIGEISGHPGREVVPAVKRRVMTIQTVVLHWVRLSVMF